MSAISPCDSGFAVRDTRAPITSVKIDRPIHTPARGSNRDLKSLLLMKDSTSPHLVNSVTRYA
jgi:hypothetical protein